MSDTLNAQSMYAEPDGSVKGFMCLTDFECEMGAAPAGNTVYASIEDLRNYRSCTAECGIVEVRVFPVRIVQPAKEPQW